MLLSESGSSNRKPPSEQGMLLNDYMFNNGEKNSKKKTEESPSPRLEEEFTMPLKVETEYKPAPMVP